MLKANIEKWIFNEAYIKEIASLLKLMILKVTDDPWRLLHKKPQIYTTWGKKKVVFKSMSKDKRDFQYRALPKTSVCKDWVSLTYVTVQVGFLEFRMRKSKWARRKPKQFFPLPPSLSLALQRSNLLGACFLETCKHRALVASLQKENY